MREIADVNKEIKEIRDKAVRREYDSEVRRVVSHYDETALSGKDKARLEELQKSLLELRRERDSLSTAVDKCEDPCKRLRDNPEIKRVEGEISDVSSQIVKLEKIIKLMKGPTKTTDTGRNTTLERESSRDYDADVEDDLINKMKELKTLRERKKRLSDQLTQLNEALDKCDVDNHVNWIRNLRVSEPKAQPGHLTVAVDYRLDPSYSTESIYMNVKVVKSGKASTYFKNTNTLLRSGKGLCTLEIDYGYKDPFGNYPPFPSFDSDQLELSMSYGVKTNSNFCVTLFNHRKEWCIGYDAGFLPSQNGFRFHNFREGAPSVNTFNETFTLPGGKKSIWDYFNPLTYIKELYRTLQKVIDDPLDTIKYIRQSGLNPARVSEEIGELPLLYLMFWLFTSGKANTGLCTGFASVSAKKFWRGERGVYSLEAKDVVKELTIDFGKLFGIDIATSLMNQAKNADASIQDVVSKVFEDFREGSSIKTHPLIFFVPSRSWAPMFLAELGSSHTVLPYRITMDQRLEDGPTRYRIYVYDSNNPGNNGAFIEVSKTNGNWDFYFASPDPKNPYPFSRGLSDGWTLAIIPLGNFLEKVRSATLWDAVLKSLFDDLFMIPV